MGNLQQLNKKMFRFVSLLMVVIYLFTMDAGAVPSLTMSAPEVSAEFSAGIQDATLFSVPSQAGSLDILSLGKDNSNQIVFHVQDAHGNREAQGQIEKIIDYLHQHYGVNTILVEGASVELNPEVIRFFPEDSAMTQKALNSLAEKGLIQGAEFSLLKNPEMRGFGIEDRVTYEKNRKNFASVLIQSEQSEKNLKVFGQALERIASIYLSSEARSFLKLGERHAMGEMGLDQYLQALQFASAKYAQIDLTDSKWQILLPTLARLFTIQKLEKKISASSFKQEREAFLSAVRPFVRETNIATEVEKLLSLNEMSAHLPAPATADLFARMIAKLPRIFDYQKYPQITSFAGMLILRSELEPEDLAHEIKMVENQIMKRLSDTEEARAVTQMFQNYHMLKKLFALELAPDEYDSIAASVGFLPSEMASDLKKLNSHQQACEIQFSNLDDLDELFRLAMKFYQGARERDEKMLGKISELMSAPQTNKVAVIAGGFHSRPFHDYFKKQGVAYALVTPKITDWKNLGRENYLNVMVAQATDRESLTDKKNAILESTRFATNARPFSALHTDQPLTDAEIFLANQALSGVLSGAESAQVVQRLQMAVTAAGAEELQQARKNYFQIRHQQTMHGEDANAPVSLLAESEGNLIVEKHNRSEQRGLESAVINIVSFLLTGFVVWLVVRATVFFLGSGFKNLVGFSGWWLVGGAIAVGIVAAWIKNAVDYIKLPQAEKKRLRINKVTRQSREIWERFFKKNNAGEAPQPNTARGKQSLEAASQIGLTLVNQSYRWKSKLKNIIQAAPQETDTVVETVTTYTESWDFDGNTWQTPSGSESVTATEFFPAPQFLEKKLAEISRSELRAEAERFLKAYQNVKQNKPAYPMLHYLSKTLDYLSFLVGGGVFLYLSFVFLQWMSWSPRYSVDWVGLIGFYGIKGVSALFVEAVILGIAIGGTNISRFSAYGVVKVIAKILSLPFPEFESDYRHSLTSGLNGDFPPYGTDALFPFLLQSEEGKELIKEEGDRLFSRARMFEYYRPTEEGRAKILRWFDPDFLPSVGIKSTWRYKSQGSGFFGEENFVRYEYDSVELQEKEEVKWVDYQAGFLSFFKKALEQDVSWEDLQRISSVAQAKIAQTKQKIGYVIINVEHINILPGSSFEYGIETGPSDYSEERRDLFAWDYQPALNELGVQLQALQNRSEIRLEANETNLWVAAGVAWGAVAIGRFFVSLYRHKDFLRAFGDAGSVFLPIFFGLAMGVALLFWPVVIGLVIFGAVWFLGSGFEDLAGFSGWWIIGGAVGGASIFLLVYAAVKALVEYVQLTPQAKQEMRFLRQARRISKAHIRLSTKNLDRELINTRVGTSTELMQKIAELMRARNARSWKNQLNRLLKSISTEEGIAFRSMPIYEEQLYSYEYGHQLVQVGTELVRDHIDVYPNPDELQRYIDDQASFLGGGNEQEVFARSEIRSDLNLKLSDVQGITGQFERPSESQILDVLLLMTGGIIPLAYRSLELAVKSGVRIRFKQTTPSSLQRFQRSLKHGGVSLGVAYQSRNFVLQVDAQNFNDEQDLLVLLAASVAGPLGRIVFVLRNTDLKAIKNHQRDLSAALERYGLKKLASRFSVVSEFESVFINADLETAWVGDLRELPTIAIGKKNMRFASARQLSGPANLFVVGQYLSSGAWDEKGLQRVIDIAQRMGLLESLKELLQSALASAQMYAKSA